MRFVFLGTGTSAGVPAIGCACDVCRSGDPRDKRLRTGAAVIFDDARGRTRVVLIDASPDLRQQALRAGLDRCDAVLFTHNHVDHTFGVDELRRFNAVMKAPIDIYAETRTIEHLRRVYQHIFEPQRNINASFVATLIPHPIQPDHPLELFGMRFTPLRLLHGGLPILGYRIEPTGPALLTRREPAQGAEEGGGAGGAGGAEVGGGERIFPLAYCTDVSGIPPESWKHLRGLGTLVLDALRHRRHPTHLTLGQAVSVAHEVGARRTYFVHMAHDLGHEQTDNQLPEGMSLAYDGLELAEGSVTQDPRRRA